MSELIINPQEELKKRNREIKKWAIIWAVITLGTIVVLFIFIVSRKTLPPNLPWWILSPAIICALSAIPLLRKAWRAEKLKEQLKKTQKGEK